MTKFIPPGFDASRVSGGIYKAMGFGEPTRAADKATFYFRSTLTVPPGTAVDEDGVPYDPDVRPTKTTPPAVQVPCAVEYMDASVASETFGEVKPSRLRITLLDTEYQQVKGFSYVAAGGDKYVYQSTEPPNALGSIDVWTVWAAAEDER